MTRAFVTKLRASIKPLLADAPAVEVSELLG